MLICHQPDGTLSTAVYRKATHTDRILNNESNHPITHKISYIQTLFNTHRSTTTAKIKERAYLHRICRQNGYSARFIQCCCKRQEPRLIHDRPTTMVWVMLPYINGISEATARILESHNINVAHKPSQTLHARIMRPKEPLSTGDMSSVVYRISCKDCHCNYVGEAAKRLQTRVHDHGLAVRHHEQHSQVWMHIAENDYTFDFVGAKVIAQDSTKGGRLLKEAWLSDRYSINWHVEL